MNQLIKSISEVYHTNLNTGLSIILWISYLGLNIYYLFYLHFIDCDCIHKLYRTYCIILGIITLILLYYIYKYKTKDTLLHFVGLLLVCDILFTYFMRKQILYLENNKCYCSYTNNNILDIKIILKYINIINICSIIICLILIFYLVITQKTDIIFT